MAMGDFLVAYLHKIGVRHVFGIPGDLALKLFFALGQNHGLEIITLSHEPGIGFAADGYVRAWSAPGFPPMRHVGYAVQWFGLAAALLVIYIVTNFRRSNQDNSA